VAFRWDPPCVSPAVAYGGVETSGRRPVFATVFSLVLFGAFVVPAFCDPLAPRLQGSTKHCFHNPVGFFVPPIFLTRRSFHPPLGFQRVRVFF